MYNMSSNLVVSLNRPTKVHPIQEIFHPKGLVKKEKLQKMKRVGWPTTLYFLKAKCVFEQFTVVLLPKLSCCLEQHCCVVWDCLSVVCSKVNELQSSYEQQQCLLWTPQAPLAPPMAGRCYRRSIPLSTASPLPCPPPSPSTISPPRDRGS
jgi:hypothetical protein